MEPLPDPLKDRMLKQLKPPPQKPLSSNLFFTNFRKGNFFNLKIGKNNNHYHN